MASSGLSRRRVGADSAAAASPGGSSNLSSNAAGNAASSDRPSSPRTEQGPTSSSGGGSRLFERSGHKVGFDPRDLEEQDEEKLVPKLTLMEEVLLLGLKDKQVRSTGAGLMRPDWRAGLYVLLERQHLLHPPRLPPHRTRAPATHSHGQGPEPPALSLGRQVCSRSFIFDASPTRRRRYIEVVDDKLTGEVLLDEALKMMKVSERMSVGTWIDLLSGTRRHCCFRGPFERRRAQARHGT
jgi:Golgi phosphoprotein 3